MRYVSHASPGIRRQRVGSGFRYLSSGGKTVRDAETLSRIRALVIPPAWTDVWICPLEDGHLQAVGRDARGRKQYRYHAHWREVRDEAKYGRLAAFGRALPRIRRRVSRDLTRTGLPREKVLATVVRLLESTFIRIGNAEYARENDSFGLTTLRERQVRVEGSRLRFKFRGKSGVPHEVALTDAQLARIVRRMQELPGEELFQYLDDEGKTRPIESTDVNAYLRSIAGDDFTSKDFRTWAGTLLCARALWALAPPRSPTAGRRDIRQAVEAASQTLRNTPAVCRKCYIHPQVFESYLAGRLQQAMRGRPEEAALIELLENRRTSFAAAERQIRARGLRLGTRAPAPRPRHAPLHAAHRRSPRRGPLERLSAR
ncbi:MAG: DNA topoisomerase IB [Burkholderiales bacterium]